MSQTVPEQASSPAKMNWKPALQSWMEQSRKIILKWLYDVGGWIFTGLIAVALMIVLNLITTGTTDRVLLVAGLVLAVALPLNLAGLWIVRYIQNLDQALAEATPPLAQPVAADEATANTASTEIFSAKKRSFMNDTITIILALSVLLTLLGLSLALWHISWAVTIVFLVAILACLFTTLWVLAYRG
jgi:hypothetical protein